MKTFGNSRQSGILLPVSCLPGRYGIGDFGPDAYKAIDIIKDCGFKIWQILPLNPVGYGNSPYQSYSSFAGDEIYIDIDRLVSMGLIDHINYGENKSDFINYDTVRVFKTYYLNQAFEGFVETDDYQQFVEEAFWLKDYAIFRALKAHHEGPWQDWSDSDYQDDDIRYHMFLQFVFYQQWMAIKQYANEKGISIVGDLPIYVGLDSADVYSHPDNFLLDENYYPTSVAGVPPDYFNDEGQLWGNPLYNWDHLKANHYDFWINRLSWNQRLYDGIRIDHFRAFDTYWSVPVDSSTAKAGHWELGPAYDLFDEIEARCPDLNLIAEDLGDLRPEVLELRDHYHLLGMRIVQYSFGKDERENNYLLPEYCIAYTGTHDNSPIVGWYEALPRLEKLRIRAIMRRHRHHGRKVTDRVIYHAFAEPSVLTIVPVQDLLRLGENARINNPGTIGAPNWCWKLQSLNGLVDRIGEIRQLISETNRL